MNLEKLIQKLKEAPCTLAWERRNANINISICKMQIKIRDEWLRKQKLKQ